MTTLAGTRGDAIRPKVAAVEVLMLNVAGAIPGVSVLALGGANGEGAGQLRQTAAGLLQWKAPGSSSFGAACDPSSGLDLLLEDGDDPNAWARVKISTAFLQPGQRDAIVRSQDVYNAVGIDDVTEGEAAAGAVEIASVDLENVSGMDVVGLIAWLDPSTVDLELSDSAGGPWVAPTTPGTALALATPIPSGGSDTLFIRRTIGAGAPSDPKVLNRIKLQWEGI